MLVSNSIQPTSAPKRHSFHQHMRALLQDYFNLEVLNHSLEHLPQQLQKPSPRPWQRIAWQDIHISQIIGISPDIFLSILVGALETEAPIQGYAQTSRAYLAPIHSPMAAYVGGEQPLPSISHATPGLWELEERQHTPALIRVYRQLTGEKVLPQERTVRSYQPTEDAEADLYRHGLHRIATEYGAACLYLWMMAHTTGPLKQVLGEILQDEVHHMANFWGFGLWLYPETHWARTLHIVRVVMAPSGAKKAHRLTHTLKRMMGVLDWQDWPWRSRIHLAQTFIQVLWRLHQWSDRLTPEKLNQLFGSSPISC